METPAACSSHAVARPTPTLLHSSRSARVSYSRTVSVSIGPPATAAGSRTVRRRSSAIAMRQNTSAAVSAVVYTTASAALAMRSGVKATPAALAATSSSGAEQRSAHERTAASDAMRLPRRAPTRRDAGRERRGATG